MSSLNTVSTSTFRRPSRRRHLKALSPPLVVLASAANDDTEDLRAHLRDIGYRVLVAPDVTSLAARLSELLGEFGWRERPAALIADLRLPGMEALHMHEVLRRLPATPPLIILDDPASSSTHSRSEDLDAAAVVHAPFDSDVVAALTAAVATPQP